jgi:hypothetical protein
MDFCNRSMVYYSRLYSICNRITIEYTRSLHKATVSYGKVILEKSCGMNIWLMLISSIMLKYTLGCPTSYSCHVDSVHLYSKFESDQIKYWNSKFEYLRIRYSSIPRRTWHFRIFLRYIREYLLQNIQDFNNSISVLGLHQLWINTKFKVFVYKSWLW